MFCFQYDKRYYDGALKIITNSLNKLGGEFRRSSSARLHRNKRNHSEIFEHLHFGHEENKRKEQVSSHPIKLNM
jgi:hypothetical protein